MCSLELCACTCSGMLHSGLLAEHTLVSSNDALVEFYLNQKSAFHSASVLTADCMFDASVLVR